MRRGLWWAVPLVLAGCVFHEKPPFSECDEGDVLACQCADGSASRQVCEDEVLGACMCERGEVEPAEYRYLIVEDDSVDEGRTGAAGADICWVVAECGGEAVVAVSASLEVGQGLVCDGMSMDAPCETGVDRRDPAAALGDEMRCEAESAPSDYVSLGLGGLLVVEFESDLSGCVAVLYVLEGRDEDRYRVYVCATPTLAEETCLLDGEPVAELDGLGGSLSVELPLAGERR